MPSRTPTVTATSLAVDCELPERWIRVTTRIEDSLEARAAAANVPIERLIRRNCLPESYRLIAGDGLLVPASDEADSAATDAVMGCESPLTASIESLHVGAVLRGMVEIRGTVGGADFRRYQLEIRPDGYLRYQVILAGNTPVNARVLGVLDTDTLPSGLAWLRVVIITDSGALGRDEICVIPVIIRHNGD